MNIFENESLLEQYLADVYRLKNVIRYNTRNKIKDESVAEHSFYVALFALKICDTFKIDDDIKQQCLIKALLHDMPEIELNDITHNVKEALNLRPFLKQYEDKYFEQKYNQYYKLMTVNNKLVDAIVIFADGLSVYQYSLNEVNLGNSSNDMGEILEESKDRINKLYLHLKDVLHELKENKHE